MDPTEIITLGIALYGAGLSTYQLITTRKEKQWQLKVHTTEGVVTYSDDTIRESVIFTANNVGHRSVTISSCGFSVEGEQRVYVNMGRETQSAPLPHELAPGQNHVFWITRKEAITLLVNNGYSGTVNLIGYFSDAIGNTYRSKPYAFNIERRNDQRG